MKNKILKEINVEEIMESFKKDSKKNSYLKVLWNGKNIEVSYAFKLVSDKEVEVLIGTPTADEETIGKKVYFSHR